MKTYVLIADINFNERADIEAIEDVTFETVAQALDTIDQTPDEHYSTQKSNSQCLVIGDFCDLVNNEEFNEGGNWITYVNIKE